MSRGSAVRKPNPVEQSPELLDIIEEAFSAVERRSEGLRGPYVIDFAWTKEGVVRLRAVQSVSQVDQLVLLPPN